MMRKSDLTKLESLLIGALGLTLQEIRAKQNGCGAAHFGLLVPDFLNRKACNDHDLCYSFGYDQTLKELSDSYLIRRLSLPEFLKKSVAEVLRQVKPQAMEADKWAKLQSARQLIIDFLKKEMSID